MVECNHVPTQRANIVLLIRWRMHENRGVFRQNNRETRGERVRDEKKNLGKSKKLVRGVQSSAARSRCEVVNATGGTPPLRAPPPQAPLHYRTIFTMHPGQKNKHIWDEKSLRNMNCVMLHILSS